MLKLNDGTVVVKFKQWWHKLGHKDIEIPLHEVVIDFLYSNFN